MIQTVIIAEDTPSKLAMRLNDWLKAGLKIRLQMLNMQ